VSFNPDDVEDYLAKFSAVVYLDANKFYVSKPVQEQPKVVVPSSLVNKDKAPEAAKPINKPNHVAQQPSHPPSINDSHTTRQGRPSLVDNFQKIRKIKDSLTINQKFMFTKVLFHGDFELFSKAIDRLDQLDKDFGCANPSAPGAHDPPPRMGGWQRVGCVGHHVAIPAEALL
jgi:hypothetical protein